MPETPMEAEGTPTRSDLTIAFRGEWAERVGGHVEKRGEFARLEGRSGVAVMVDRRAVELAALALGIELRR